MYKIKIYMYRVTEHVHLKWLLLELTIVVITRIFSQGFPRKVDFSRVVEFTRAKF